MNVEIIKKGTEIIESCLDKCERLRLDVNVFKPNQDVMDMLLAKDYLILCFNGDEPDSSILIFHNSEDEYAHNGDIKFTCYLTRVPRVHEYVKKHKKVIALIKNLKEVKKNEN